MPLAHFSVTVFAIRTLAIANGQLRVADGINCPAMWAVKAIAMTEFPSSTHCGVHLSVVSSHRQPPEADRCRANTRITSAPQWWQRYTTSSSSSPAVGMVGTTSETLIGIRHLGQSCTAPITIVPFEAAILKIPSPIPIRHLTTSRGCAQIDRGFKLIAASLA